MLKMWGGTNLMLYPRADLMLLPESHTQSAIRPTQLIFHSLAADWTNERTYQYWKESTNLESHFGIQYDGAVAQYMDTQRRADANAGANMRSDGTGAISCETQSDLGSTDPWTAAQLVSIVRMCQWANVAHGIPLRVPTNHAAPGIGYHKLFREWSTSGTACPGVKRTSQFLTIVLPMLRGELMDFTDAQLREIAEAVLNLDIIPNTNGPDEESNPTLPLREAMRRVGIMTRRTDERVVGIGEGVQTLLERTEPEPPQAKVTRAKS